MPIIDNTATPEEHHEKEVKKFKEETGPSITNVFSNMSNTERVVLLAISEFVLYLSKVGSVYWYILPVGAYIFLSSTEPEKMSSDITIDQAINIAYMYVCGKQKINACPQGYIDIHADRAALRTTIRNGQTIKDYWEIGCTIRDEDFLETIYSIGILTDGRVRHMKLRPAGFDGTEARDVIEKVIPMRDMPFAKGYLTPKQFKGGSYLAEE